MPRYQLSIPKILTWADDDVLVLLVGTLNAADLDSSTPAGGTEHERWPIAAISDADNENLVTEFYYDAPPGTCATLPVGVAVEDAQGNRSNDWDYTGTVHVRTAPVGVGRPTATATANPNEALLEWVGSESIEA